MTPEEHLIGDSWVSGDGPPFSSTCPVNDQVVWSGQEASKSQVDRAFTAARNAWGAWWDKTSDQRIEIIRRYGERVTQSLDELAQVIARETGKPLWESKTEAAAVVGKIDISIDAFHARRDTTIVPLGETNGVTRFKPHGVCAVLGPFNFPAHLPNGHIVPALIAGNTIVFKPSEMTPAVGAWMVKKWEQAGLPAGVLNLVQGGKEVGQAVAQHPELDGLFFTGSSHVGRALHRGFAETPQKILALEMGGNNPLIVHEVEDLKGAAYLTVLSAYATAGQRCTCARRLILVDDQRCQRFLDALEEMIESVTCGFYDDQPQPFMGTVISGAMGRRMLEAQDALIAQNGKPRVIMKSLRGCDALVSPGLIDVTDVKNRSDEELFGPLLNVIRVSCFEEAIEEANRTAYGLSAGLLSDHEPRYREFLHRIRAGIVNWNRQTTGASGRLPFGGCGLSGNHRPSAWYAADYCSFPVASLESDRVKLPEKLAIGINA